jgi:thioredoxin family protein
VIPVRLIPGADVRERAQPVDAHVRAEVDDGRQRLRGREAFANHYWPALYFIDADGRIRHHRFGEGDYERSESVIQMLLAETGFDDDDRQEYVSVDARGPEAPADRNGLLSPETYLGYRQTMNFASPGGLARDEPWVYEAPEQLRRNHWSLSGDRAASAEAPTPCNRLDDTPPLDAARLSM